MPTEKWPAVWRAEEQVTQVNLSHKEAQLAATSARAHLALHSCRLSPHPVELAPKPVRLEFVF